MKAFEILRRRPSATISFVLGLVTFLLYLPIVQNGFVNYDDQGYITDNPHVTKGLSASNIIWAFKTETLANWHPLTWLSHMADYEIFGAHPAGHHFVNVLFHTANTLLVFFLLKQMTREIWASALVAALFGWHPLHVESVAWASERKDVLCAFFWLLAMMFFVKYVRKPRVVDYLMALALFACALMSKPMAVTLPFVLLLIDYWPLNRFALDNHQTAHLSPKQIKYKNLRTGIFLFLEKLPFFALSLGDAYLTFHAQKNAGAVLAASILPFSDRLTNALWSYLRYVSLTFFPTGLSVIYPYRTDLPLSLITTSIILLMTWSLLFLHWRKRFPYLLIGWLWFLGVLIPTIGLVQAGAQSMADRYMYIPSIGLFILLGWSAQDVIRFYPRSRKLSLITATGALALCLIATSFQISYWSNTITLFTHAIKVTGDNSVAYYCLGTAYEANGNQPMALALYKKSIETGPNYYPAQYNLGKIELANGDYTAAISHFNSASKLPGADSRAQFQMGAMLLTADKFAESISFLRTATELEPDNPENHFYLAFALQKMAITSDALLEYSNALHLQPDYSDARYGLAAALTTAGKTNEALAQYRIQVQLQPRNPEARYNLGLALLDGQKFAAAETEFNTELQLSPLELKAHYRLAQTFAAEHNFTQAVTQYREALRILPDFPDAKKELDALFMAHPELK